MLALQAEVTRLKGFGHGVSCTDSGACNLCKSEAGLVQLSVELEGL